MKRNEIFLNVLNGNAEIFVSIQGEGRYIGKEAVFVRLKGCPVGCSWCDTRETWDMKSELNEGMLSMPVSVLGDMILEKKVNLVVITGGEPLLQQDSLVALIRYVRKKNSVIKFHVETSGVIVPTDAILEVVSHWNISPKLANSGVELEKRWNFIALRELRDVGCSDLKFVVSSVSDMKEIEVIVDTIGMTKDRVYLMPLGTTVEELDRNEQVIDSIIKEKGYMKSTREHIRLFGNERGR